jgi:hypothetical protein
MVVSRKHPGTKMRFKPSNHDNKDADEQLQVLMHRIKQRISLFLKYINKHIDAINCCLTLALIHSKPALSSLGSP